MWRDIHRYKHYGSVKSICQNISVSYNEPLVPGTDQSYSSAAALMFWIRLLYIIGKEKFISVTPLKLSYVKDENSLELLCISSRLVGDMANELIKAARSL
jgi:hypothetical protein